MAMTIRVRKSKVSGNSSLLLNGWFHSFPRLLAQPTTFHYDQVANLMILQCQVDVDLFRSRPSFTLFRKISEHRF
jgi:hypothetical protein